MTEVLSIGVRRTQADHLKVDVGGFAVDLRNSPPVTIFGLRFEADWLPEDQTLEGLGGPRTTLSLTGFWCVDTSQSDGDPSALGVLDPDGVSITYRDQDNWTRDKTSRTFS